MRIRNLIMAASAATALALAAAAAAAAPTPEAAPAAPAASAPGATDLLPPSAFVSESPTAEDFRAEGKPLRSNALTIHPAFSLLISGMNISYEAALGQGLWNFEVPLYLGYNERVYTNPTFFTGTGFGVRRYLLERGAGTYVAPSLDVLNVHRFEKDPVDGNARVDGNNVLLVVPNLRMGHRWTWNVFTMDVSAGFAYYEAIATEGKLSSEDPDQRGLIPMVQYSLGVPF